jgi:ectoine utilization protein EutC
LPIVILSEVELRQCVLLDTEVVEAVGRAFSSLALGQATLPPVMTVEIPDCGGEVDVKTAYLAGEESFAIKIASGFVGNARLGLPTGSGLMVLISAQTGFPQALLLDNGYLTNVRTGAAGALAAQYLAPARVRTAGVIGSGTQARYQVQGLRLVRHFEQLLVYGVVPDEVERYVGEMREALAVEVTRAASAEEVVRHSDVVITTTPSRQPYVRKDWLHQGLHMTCMGSDVSHKQELYANVIGRADRLVCDLKAQCFQLGELHHALKQGVLSADADIIELGELTTGKRLGRQSEDEITICDLTGVGVQDTAIALLAYRRAIEGGLGTPFGN